MDKIESIIYDPKISSCWFEIKVQNKIAVFRLRIDWREFANFTKILPQDKIFLSTNAAYSLNIEHFPMKKKERGDKTRIFCGRYTSVPSEFQWLEDFFLEQHSMKGFVINDPDQTCLCFGYSVEFFKIPEQRPPQKTC